jgi:hypothetical protein
MTNKEYHIELLQEEWDSLIAGKEISLFETDEEKFMIYIKKPTQRKEEIIIDYDIIEDELKQDVMDRYADSEEYYDMRLREELIYENVLNLKEGDLIAQRFFDNLNPFYFLVEDTSKVNNYLLREDDEDGEIVAELELVLQGNTKQNIYKVVYTTNIDESDEDDE